MNQLTFCFLIFVTGTSVSQGKSFLDSYEEINNSLRKKIKICNRQNEQIVKKAFIELKENIKNNEYIKFEQDEMNAIKYIDSFNFSNSTQKDEYQYLKLILNNCSGKNLLLYRDLEKKRATCLNIFDEYRYMLGLIYAYKYYDWSPETKKKTKGKILSYIFTSTTEEAPIPKVLLSLDLMISMTKYGLLDKKYLAEINKIKNKIKKKMKKLKNYLEISSKNSSCNDFKKSTTYGAKINLESRNDIALLLEKFR